MDLGLTGRVALVAASSRGLGRAVAEELAAEGARLILCARGAEALEETREAIAATTGVEVTAVPTDLSDAGEIRQLVEQGTAALGPVDILVNNAGGPPPGPFESHSLEAWRDAARLNLESAVELTRAVLPGMKERRWGRILNVTSVSAREPVDNLILSTSVRAAVHGFARALANEVGAFGVTVNNVLPGYTRTRRLEQLAEEIAAARGASLEQVIEEMGAGVPAGRLGEPREFAALVAFLASDRASYINGVSVAVDGGRTRALF